MAMALSAQRPVGSIFLQGQPKRLKKEAPSSVLVTTSKALVTSSDALVPSSFLLLVVWPGAPSSVLVPSSDGLQPTDLWPPGKRSASLEKTPREGHKQGFLDGTSPAVWKSSFDVFVLLGSR